VRGKVGIFVWLFLLESRSRGCVRDESQRKMNVGVESSIESEVLEGRMKDCCLDTGFHRGKRTTYIDPSAS